MSNDQPTRKGEPFQTDTTSFESELIKRILAERKIKPASAKTYALNLRRLRNIINGNNDRTPLNDLKFLSNTAAVVKAVDGMPSLVN